MKKSWIILLLLPLLVSSCMLDLDLNLDCVSASRRMIYETRQLRNFDQIYLQIAAEVVIKQGNESSVDIEASDNLMNILTTNVSGGVLKISSRSCIRNSGTIRIYITTPNLVAVNSYSSGNIKSYNRIYADNFSIISSGSGNIDLDLDVIRLNTNISGSGDIYLSGLADYQDVSLRGSGNLDAYDISSLEVKAKLSGSGNARFDIRNYLEASLTGSGSLYYKGFPKTNIRITGSGSVYKN